jgi:hypothetical protein
MTEFGIALWAVGIVAWLAFAFYVYWIARRVWNDRLMRCPETGAVILVGVEYGSPGAGQPPQLTVKRCGLWPEKRNCARGCLARYDESVPGLPANLDALKPFVRL